MFGSCVRIGVRSTQVVTLQILLVHQQGPTVSNVAGPGAVSTRLVDQRTAVGRSPWAGAGTVAFVFA